MKPFKVLCIGGSDTSSGAGIQADLKAVSACGCWGLTVITAVTAQNTKGISGIHPVPATFVEKQMHAVLSDIGADAIKTGMLPTEEIIRIVTGIIKKYRIKKLIVDPVMVAKGGKILMNRKARMALMKDLLPLAFAVTPNIPEAEVLAKMKIKSIDNMKKAAAKIQALGVSNVLIKGGHLAASRKTDVTDVLYDGGFYEFSSERINARNTHGTGCTYASSMAAGIAKGDGLVDAALRSKIMVIAAIREAAILGKGYASVNVLGDNILTK
jgi:hydroxymethylpyrimidine kinase/phosphomethylpyrimidine kinase